MTLGRSLCRIAIFGGICFAASSVPLWATAGLALSENSQMLAQMIASVVAGNTANAIDNFDLSRPDYLVWVNPVPRERWAMFTAGKIDIIMINCLRGCLGMNEIIFWVKCDAEEGYIAQALGESIITQADNLDRLKLEVRDAVRCHFPDEELHPPMIRLVTEDGITL